jgi:lysozyme family protein
VTPDDVAALLEPEARAIYRKWYVENPGFDVFADPARWVMVDLGVLHGPTNAVLMLQQALGDKHPDGTLGPITLTIAKAVEPERLARLLLAQRAEFFGKLIAHDPTQAKFAYGWLRERVANLLRAVA